jgi:hypothetical protein
VESFPADQFTFREKGDVYVVQEAEAGREQEFNRWIEQAGFVYNGVASITDLNQDGDCHRTVECERLEILNPNSARAESHEFELPRTSGYVDLLEAAAEKDSAYEGLYLERRQANQGDQTEAAAVRWGPQGTRLTPKDIISYRYYWWALNSFAMNGRQFRKKYRDPSLLEFTHFPVSDPIRELLVVLRFPTGFSPGGRPHIRVTEIDNFKTDNRLWTSNRELESELEEKRALRYLESVGIAALRVSMPRQNFCYGIEWKVPEIGADSSDDPQVQQLQNRLLRASRDTSKKPVLLSIVKEIGRITRSVLIPQWTRPLEFSLMLFDDSVLKLVAVSSARVANNGDITELDKSNVMFAHGEGIAGRAFKSNESRLYVHREFERRTSPRYYRPHAGKDPDSVLLAFPLQSPKKTEYVFGVLNVTSMDSACPLSRVLDVEGPISEKTVSTFQTALNLCVISGLQTLADNHII